MPTKRHVRRPPRTIKDQTPGFMGHIKRFFLSFTPKYFKDYWLGRDGLVRLGKLAGAGAILVFLIFLWYAKDLPTPGKINARVSAQTTKFYDASGNHLLYELYGDQNRSIVAFDQISDHAKNATIAIEDKDFYSHGAFSFVGIMRAAISDVTNRNTAQGGSTITQQYVKNALLDPNDHSFSRKIKELIVSLEIGQFYSKKDILTLYLNEIPYGNRAYGIESACKTFFPQNKDLTDKDQLCAKNLDLGQSALLAAILNGPSYYSPFGAHTPDLIERQHLVLERMVEQKFVTQEQAAAAQWAVEDLKNATKISQQQNLYANLDPKVAHFVLYAQDFLENKYGTSAVTEGGLRVLTSMDYDKQMAAYTAVANNMKSVRALGGSNAALVSTDPKTGHLLSMIGSYDFNDNKFGNFNVALAKRQPGSSFKPIVYATLFDKNSNASCAKSRECPTYGPGTTLYDVSTEFGTTASPYRPQNFGGKSYGVVTARQALAGSLNIPAVKVLAMAGVNASIQTANNIGITTLNNPPKGGYGLSLVLGTGGVQLIEMANAYESFANGGLHYEQTPILKLYDQKGSIMEDNSKPKKPKQGLDPQVAYLVADILSDNNAKQYVFGNGLALRNVCATNQGSGCVHAGVKTGTTEHFNDAWTMGFTPDLVGGVWVGNNDNSPMSAAAADVAAPIWKAFMNTSINGKANSPFTKPSGIKTVSLDKQTGRSVTSGTKTTTVDSFPSWYAAMSSANGRSAVIDKVSGKLATECTPELAKETAYSSAVLPEITKADNSFQYQNWLSALQRAGYSTTGGDLPTSNDDVHSCDDTKPTVNLSGASGGGPYNLNVNVTLGAFGTEKPGTGTGKLDVYFDDQVISSQQISASGTYNVSYNPTVTGDHTFKAIFTDTGLYQTTDSDDVTVTATGADSSTSGDGSSSFTGKTPSEGAQVALGSVTFTWTADPGASSYGLYVDGNLRGNSNTTSRTMTIVTPGNHTWYVRADNGNATTPMTFRAK